jgi:hypothetical protein
MIASMDASVIVIPTPYRRKNGERLHDFKAPKSKFQIPNDE